VLTQRTCAPSAATTPPVSAAALVPAPTAAAAAPSKGVAEGVDSQRHRRHML